MRMRMRRMKTIRKRKLSSEAPRELQHSLRRTGAGGSNSREKRCTLGAWPGAVLVALLQLSAATLRRWTWLVGVEGKEGPGGGACILLEGAGRDPV